jgi:hypothetical protein
VQATGELLGKVLTDFYPTVSRIWTVPGAVRASLAKATLRGLGIVPPLDSNPDFPVDMLGASMEAFYGDVPRSVPDVSMFPRRYTTSQACTRP